MSHQAQVPGVLRVELPGGQVLRDPHLRPLGVQQENFQMTRAFALTALISVLLVLFWNAIGGRLDTDICRGTAMPCWIGETLVGFWVSAAVLLVSMIVIGPSLILAQSILDRVNKEKK